MKFAAAIATSAFFACGYASQEVKYSQPFQYGHLNLLSGSSNIALASEVAAHLKVNLGRVDIGLHSDGETRIRVYEDLRGKDVYLI
jgi:hypothetical protein